MDLDLTRCPWVGIVGYCLFLLDLGRGRRSYSFWKLSSLSMLGQKSVQSRQLGRTSPLPGSLLASIVQNFDESRVNVASHFESLQSVKSLVGASLI